MKMNMNSQALLFPHIDHYEDIVMEIIKRIHVPGEIADGIITV